MDSAQGAELIEYPGTTPVGEATPMEPAVRDPFGLESITSTIQSLSETKDLADQSIAELIKEVAAPSLAELERMIRELQEARAYLDSEGQRVEREAQRYVQLSETTLESVKVISGAVSEWRKAGHPV
jgi:uncharacterized protein (DUF3084 family)